MKGFSLIQLSMDMDVNCLIQVIFIKANTNRIDFMEMVSIYGKMALLIKGILLTEREMAEEGGNQIQQGTILILGNIRMIKNQAKANIFGIMVASMMVNLRMI